MKSLIGYSFKYDSEWSFADVRVTMGIISKIIVLSMIVLSIASPILAQTNDVDTIVSEFKETGEKVSILEQSVLYDNKAYAITQVGSTYIIVEGDKGVIPGQDTFSKVIKAYQYSIESKNIDRSMIRDMNHQASTISSASNTIYQGSNGIIDVIDGLSTKQAFGFGVGVSPRDVANAAVMLTTGTSLDDIRAALSPVRDASKEAYDISSSISTSGSNLLNNADKLRAKQIKYSDATSMENDISTITANIDTVTDEIDNVRNTMKSTVGMLQKLQSIGGELPGVSSLAKGIIDAESSLADASSDLKEKGSSLSQISSDADSKSSTETRKSIARLDGVVDARINNAEKAKSGINNLVDNLRDSGMDAHISVETTTALSRAENLLNSAKSLKGKDYYAALLEARKASVEGDKAAKSAYEDTIVDVNSYASVVENAAYIGKTDISDAASKIRTAESRYNQKNYAEAVTSLNDAVTSLDASLKGATLKNYLTVGAGAIIGTLIMFIIVKTRRKKRQNQI